MSRLWPNGIVIKVWADAEGAPRELIRRETVHPVAAISRRWRSDWGWWRLRVWREYFKVETQTGGLVEIYHDLMTDKWYLQRWYD